MSIILKYFCILLLKAVTLPFVVCAGCGAEVDAAAAGPALLPHHTSGGECLPTDGGPQPLTGRPQAGAAAMPNKPAYRLRPPPRGGFFWGGGGGVGMVGEARSFLK